MNKDNNKENNNDNIKICSVGGEALMEGIMMRGPEGIAQVMRNPEGNLILEIKKQKPLSSKNSFFRLPIIRGFIGIVDSLGVGMKALFRSAEVCGLDDETTEESSKFDKFIEKKLGDKAMGFFMTISLFVAVALSIGLFFLLPNFIATLIVSSETKDIWYHLAEGLIRLIIFMGYLIMVAQMKDVRRVFMYHGAEHKTIHCYEHKEPLTVVNVRKYTTLHPRCGTAFLFVVMIISILIYALIPRYDFFLYNMLLRIVLIPLIAGIAYEFNRFASKHENWLTKILRAPGLGMQKFTTREPDDSMIECAILALSKALELSNESVPVEDKILSQITEPENLVKESTNA